jgi:hypothetical protein
VKVRTWEFLPSRLRAAGVLTSDVWGLVVTIAPAGLEVARNLTAPAHDQAATAKAHHHGE